MVDRDFALHASDSLPHRSGIGWDWRPVSLFRGDRHHTRVRPRGAAARRQRAPAFGSPAYAEPRQRRLSVFNRTSSQRIDQERNSSRFNLRGRPLPGGWGPSSLRPSRAELSTVWRCLAGHMGLGLRALQKFRGYLCLKLVAGENHRRLDLHFPLPAACSAAERHGSDRLC